MYSRRETDARDYKSEDLDHEFKSRRFCNSKIHELHTYDSIGETNQTKI
jgi:hypothetical protein